MEWALSLGRHGSKKGGSTLLIRFATEKNQVSSNSFISDKCFVISGLRLEPNGLK